MTAMRAIIAATLLAIWPAIASAPPTLSAPQEFAESVRNIVDIDGPSSTCLCWLHYTAPSGRRQTVAIRPTGTIERVCTGDELALCADSENGRRQVVEIRDQQIDTVRGRGLRVSTGSIARPRP